MDELEDLFFKIIRPYPNPDYYKVKEEFEDSKIPLVILLKGKIQDHLKEGLLKWMEDYRDRKTPVFFLMDHDIFEKTKEFVGFITRTKNEIAKENLYERENHLFKIFKSE